MAEDRYKDQTETLKSELVESLIQQSTGVIIRNFLDLNDDPATTRMIYHYKWFNDSITGGVQALLQLRDDTTAYIFSYVPHELYYVQAIADAKVNSSDEEVRLAAFR